MVRQAAEMAPCCRRRAAVVAIDEVYRRRHRGFESNSRPGCGGSPVRSCYRKPAALNTGASSGQFAAIAAEWALDGQRITACLCRPMVRVNGLLQPLVRWLTDAC